MTTASTQRCPDLATARYVALTTFRRNGTPVTTPVGFIRDGDALFIQTGRDSGKVKRLRHRPEVAVAPCTRTGQITGATAPALATIVADSDRSRQLSEPSVVATASSRGSSES